MNPDDGKFRVTLFITNALKVVGSNCWLLHFSRAHTRFRSLECGLNPVSSWIPNNRSLTKRTDCQKFPCILWVQFNMGLYNNKVLLFCLEGFTNKRSSRPRTEWCPCLSITRLRDCPDDENWLTRTERRKVNYSWMCINERRQMIESPRRIPFKYLVRRYWKTTSGKGNPWVILYES